MKVLNNELEEIKHVLHLYGLCIEKEQYYLKEALSLQMEIDDMMMPRGVSFEENLGSNRNPKSTPAINQKQHELAYLDKKAEEYREKYEYLDEKYKIEDRLKLLPKNQKMIIELVFFKKRSYDSITDDEQKKVSRQSVSERVKNALNSFMNIHVGVGTSDE